MSDPERVFESVELKRIVSDKTTDQLETHLELPLINDEKEAVLPAMAHCAGGRKGGEPAAEKSDIPLPHENAPVEDQFPQLVDRLLKYDILDPQDKVEWQRLCASVSKEAATHFVMAKWKSNDAAGRRWKDGPKCFTPDQTLFPGATTTSFRLDNFLLLMGDQQPETVAYLTQGFQEGFKIHIDEEYLADYETTIFQNGKNPSPEADEALAKTFRENRELGHTAPRPPLWGAVYVATPVRAEPKKDGGVAQPGKFRPVQNLSKAGEGKRSVNGGIHERNSRIKYKTVEDAAEYTILMKRRTGELVYFSKFDQKAAYRLLPIHPSQVGLLGFRDNESPPREWVELRLPFGLASACRMYSCLSNTLGWALQHIVGSGTFCVYLDDFLQINAGKERSVTSSQSTLLTFGILDMPLSDKTDIDVEAIVFLGVGLDSRDETLSITEKRKGNILKSLDTWLTSTTFKTHELESLSGVLSFITRVIRPGKIFLTRVWATLAHCRTKHYNANHEISAELRKDLQWWRQFLVLWDRSCKMVDGTEEVIPDYHSTSDAASFGGASVLVPEFLQVKWEGELEYLAALHINVREMFMVATSGLTFGHRWSGKLVIFHCDNLSDVFAVLKGKSKNKEIMHLIRVLHYAAALHGFAYEIRHIRGVDNILADMASRMDVEVFLRECKTALTRIQPILPPRPDNPNWERVMAEESAQAMTKRRV